MSYISWPTNVNKIILDSTSVEVGNGGSVQDSLETGGQRKSRLSCANPADRFSVSMTFNCMEKGEDGLTEYERFVTWYKWMHCYGTNPFRFPAILINSNRQQGFSQEDVSYGNIPDYEYYRIVSPLNCSKSGYDQRISMTWETYATGAITIPDEESEVDHITAENGYVDIFLTKEPVMEPTELTYSLYINQVLEPLVGVSYYGGSQVRLFFEEKAEDGRYVAVVSGKSSIFYVGQQG